MKQNNIIKDGSALLIAITLVVIGMLVTMGMMLHLHNSLVEAVNMLESCNSSGMSNCHIERDRWYYNVYGEFECDYNEYGTIYVE